MQNKTKKKLIEKTDDQFNNKTKEATARDYEQEKKTYNENYKGYNKTCK